MRCPICDAENPDTALECQLCGKELQRDAAPALAPAGEPLPGLERTAVEGAASASGRDAQAPFEDLEPTSVGDGSVDVEVQPIEIVRSEAEVPERATPYWDTAAPELLPDRAEDDGVRTPAPDRDGLCAFCGETSFDAICANCGQRRDRFLAPPRQALAAGSPGDRVLCPACFARVPAGPRCIECGVPFPPAMGGAEP